MILDTLQHIGRYRGLHPRLDIAIGWLLTHDVHALPEGRTEVAGEDVFINVMSPALGDNRIWEKHRLYADIQIALQDGESIAWVSEQGVLGFDAYDPARGDIQFSQDTQPGIVMPIAQGSFGLYFPEDAHRPGIGTGTTRKVVVKVRVC